VGAKGINNKDCIDYMRIRTLLTLLRIVEIHEQATSTVHHSDRVATVSYLIGKEMGLPEREIAVLWRAALLHDLGKIGIGSNVVRGRKKLKGVERIIVNQHPQWGYDILKILGFFSYEGQIIKQHHENFDGTGYPDGLKGKNIHLFARIIHTVDVYDALTAFRTYRPRLFPNKAIAYILKNSGLQFDPNIVSIFMKVKESERFRNLYV
jgi:putative nucleotidyltransferase with HDIG domain